MRTSLQRTWTDGAADLWGREPAVIMYFVRAVMITLLVFGITLADAQIAAVLLLVEAGLMVLTRSRVSPSTEVPTREVELPEPPAIPTVPTPADLPTLPVPAQQ